MVSRGHLHIIRGVLIDLSGTLHVEDTAIPGACEALNRLKSSGLLVRFLTNTTKESKNVLLSRLLRCGFDISSEEIFSSLTAARQYIEKKNLNPLLLLENEALEDFEEINSITSSKENDAVVVGLAPNKFNYEDLNEAFRLLINGAELIAIHKGRYYSRGDGLAMGPGPFVNALEYASGKTACVLGKPEKSFFYSALEGLNCEPHEVVMIGDDIRDDVEGALCAGLQAILVRTGKYRPGDEDKSKIMPSAVCNNFSAAVDFILEKNDYV